MCDAMIGRVEFKPWFASAWWKDICSIGTNIETNKLVLSGKFLEGCVDRKYLASGQIS
jgi:hypothetical protein